jgi:4a-hydroxytetrahydrobiopterin dehydratase
MEDPLPNRACQPCRKDSPSATAEERERFLRDLPEWTVRTVDGEDRLHRVFRFRNFAEALSFTNRIGAMAEEEGHHPLLTTEWGRVTVEWWTHKIGGLHRNDFILAARTDRAYGP